MFRVVHFPPTDDVNNWTLAFSVRISLVLLLISSEKAVNETLCRIKGKSS